MLARPNNQHQAIDGGEGGIRTHGPRERVNLFETAFHSTGSLGSPLRPRPNNQHQANDEPHATLRKAAANPSFIHSASC